MSFCLNLFRRLFEAALMFLAITYMPGIPPHDMTFTAFSVTDPMELEGALAINDQLNGAERLFEGEIKGPEGFAVANDTLYTGLRGGAIVKLVKDKLVPVADLGHPCAGSWDEKNCGRLLGITFDKRGSLYAVDAYYGVYKINVQTGKHQLLIPTDKPIEGKKVMLANSVAVAQDGTIYWTASSCDTNLEDALLTILGDGTGRLFKYDPRTKTNTLLIDNIHFANGVVLSTKEDFVVVAETVRARLLRYWLTGTKKGTWDVFVDGLPGLPDNLRSNKRGGFFVPLVTPRFKGQPLLGDLMAPYPTLRRFLVHLISLIELPFVTIQRLVPNYYTGSIAHWICHFESVTPLLPRGLLVLGVDETGRVVESLHGMDGRVTGVSDVEFVDQTYYFGSPFNNFLGRKKTRIPIHVKMSTKQPEDSPKS